MPKKKFNEHERNQMKQAFALFDLDGNGFITNDELGTVLRKICIFFDINLNDL